MSLLRVRPLAGIAANLLVGDDALRRRMLGRWLEIRPKFERWAVLDNGAFIEPPQGAGRSGVTVRTVADACVCCNAVTLRVELTRLLRQARPNRLLILPSAEVRTPELLRLLTDRWLAPVLDIRATVGVMAAADAGALLSGPVPPDWLGQADIIALELGSFQLDEVARIQDGLALAAPGVQVQLARNGELDLGLLNVLARSRPPLFHSGLG